MVGQEDSALADPSSNGSGIPYSNLDWARAYQRTGLVLLPLWPGMKMVHSSKQHPERALLGAGFTMSEVGECSEEWVQRCWGQGDPRGVPNNGIGVVTGSRSRLLIVDIDVKNGGEGPWEDWVLEQRERGRELPEGPLVRTPSGGFHFWLRLPEGLEVKSFDGWLPGVDILANGHWTILPPTFINEKGKQYEFIRSCPVPEVPGWLLEDIEARRETRRLRPGSGGGVGEGERFVWADVLSRQIPPGEQDITLYRAACSARSRGWDDEKALLNLRLLASNFITAPGRDPWTDEQVVDKWERAKAFDDGDGVDGELDEDDIPEYTPWSPEVVEEVEEVDVTGVDERPRLRIIQGEGGGTEEEVSEPESPTGGDGAVGGAGGAVAGGGWDRAPITNNTDEENAREFHELYGDRVLWVPALEWHAWTGTHWQPDNAYAIERLLVELGDRLKDRIRFLRGIGDPDEHADALEARVKKLWTTAQLVGVKKRAAAHAQRWGGQELTAEDLDFNFHLLATPECSLVIGDRDNPGVTTRPHQQEDLNTRCTAVNYVPGARSELLDRWRSTFMPEDDHWEALWRLVGSCLVGGNPHRQLLFFYGPGTTGKSQLAGLITAVLGSYADTGSSSIFRGNLDDKPRPDLLKFMRTRILFIDEASDSWELHGDRVKALTNGEKQTARGMHKDTFVTRTLEGTALVTTNVMPRINQPDAALLRRLRVIPFTRSLNVDEENEDLRRVMLTDPATREAVLAEMIAGLIRAQVHGVHDVPQAFKEASLEAHSEVIDVEDVGAFMSLLRLRGLLVPEERMGHSVLLGDLFTIFKGLHPDSSVMTAGRNHPDGPKRELGRRIRLLEYEGKKHATKNINGGMRLLGWKLTKDPVLVIADLVSRSMFKGVVN